MKPQSGRLVIRQLEAEVLREPSFVALDRQVQRLGRNLIEPGQIGVEHDSLPTDAVDGGLDGYDRNCRHVHAAGGFVRPCRNLEISQYGPLPYAPGEAAVISLALHASIPTVAIDERNARHIARSCGLLLTGSLGLLIRAQRLGASIDLSDAIQRMRAAGVWISENLAQEALRLAKPN